MVVLDVAAQQDRLGEDVLLCLFAGEIKTVDIHEHAETIHFGVDAGDDPANVVGYKKALRNKDGVPGEKRPGIAVGHSQYHLR